MFLSQNKIINEAPINGINKIDPGTIPKCFINKKYRKKIINIPRKEINIFNSNLIYFFKFDCSYSNKTTPRSISHPLVGSI